MDVRYPEIEVQLSGADGNVFSIIGSVSAALRRARVPREEIDAFQEEAMNCDSYDGVIQLCMRTVEIS